MKLPVPEHVDHLNLFLRSVFFSDDIVWPKCLDLQTVSPDLS